MRRHSWLTALLLAAAACNTQYTLEVAAEGNGSTSPPPGVHSFSRETSVRVTATPANGATFTGWSGAASGTANPATVIVNGDVKLTAHFTASGGSSSGGTGSSSGGSSGGSSSGGASSGGSSSGGSSSGGSSPSGSSSGGSSSGGSSSSGGGSSSGGNSGPPPERTVRVFYLHPSDVPLDQRYPDGIARVMRDAQAFFKEKLGKTFVLNEPIVEVVKGEKTRSFYENTNAFNAEKYWWSVFNGADELKRRFGLRDYDPRWVIVEEISAEGDGAGGGGGGGWVLLPGHDADGAAGYPANTSRWVGGMVHELGHAFGLPDSTHTDGTCMSASFYEFPDCTFTQAHKDGMLNGQYGAFLR